MRLKQAMRYQFRDFIRPTAIFYAIVVAIFVLTWLITLIITGTGDGGNITMDTTAVIFLFVLGLNSFKNPFKVYLQNGISRRTQHASFAICALVLALIASILESVVIPLAINNTIGRVSSTFAMIYNPANDLVGHLTGIMWNFMAFYAALCFGYFLTTLFYRLSKPLKVIVAVGVPLLLFVILPMVEVFVPTFNLFTSILRFLSWSMGVEINMNMLFGIMSGSNVVVYPWRAVASFAVFSAVMLGLTYLLMRRATLKES